MKLISPDYLKEQRTLHAKAYGSSGHYWLGHVLELCEIIQAKTVLDYGAGKGTLGPYLKRYGLKYTPYDPVTFPTRPTGLFDLVVCLDVLEHIEERYVDEVFKDLRDFTSMALFANVSTRPSSKSLSDGRNAHICLHDYEWWKPRFKTGWTSGRTRQQDGSFDCVVFRKPPPVGVRPVAREMIDRLRGNI